MIPRLGKKYNIEIETTSKPYQEYRTEGYAKLGLPLAPAIIVGDEMVAQSCDVTEEKVEASICRQLGVPEPAPHKKSIFDKLLGK